MLYVDGWRYGCVKRFLTACAVTIDVLKRRSVEFVAASDGRTAPACTKETVIDLSVGACLLSRSFPESDNVCVKAYRAAQRFLGGDARLRAERTMLGGLGGDARPCARLRVLEFTYKGARRGCVLAIPDDEQVRPANALTLAMAARAVQNKSVPLVAILNNVDVSFFFDTFSATFVANDDDDDDDDDNACIRADRRTTEPTSACLTLRATLALMTVMGYMTPHLAFHVLGRSSTELTLLSLDTFYEETFVQTCGPATHGGGGGPRVCLPATLSNGPRVKTA